MEISEAPLAVDGEGASEDGDVEIDAIKRFESAYNGGRSGADGQGSRQSEQQKGAFLAWRKLTQKRSTRAPGGGAGEQSGNTADVESGASSVLEEMGASTSQKLHLHDGTGPLERVEHDVVSNDEPVTAPPTADEL